MADSVVIADWIRYASSDLITARQMFENVYPKQTEIAVFHSQQCAEKALKSFLLCKGVEPPKIHDWTCSITRLVIEQVLAKCSAFCCFLAEVV
jgi:HEPN domain-containing protein